MAVHSTHPTAVAEPTETASDVIGDDLAPMRGVANGLLLSIPMWLLIIITSLWFALY